jgi:hypothetical protein
MLDRFYRSHFHLWLATPRGATIYFITMYALVFAGFMLLTGCVTEREAIVTFYTQAEIDAITARLQCQRLARNSFQLALCEPVRR